MKNVVILIAAAALTASGAANAADVLPAGRASAGEVVFQQCAACHAVGQGAQNGVGPSLNGVVGRGAGRAPGYRYSSAMRGSGLTWDRATLARFLSSPSEAVPGTRMGFSGLSSPQDRADVIAYLQQFAPDGRRSGR
jgi:cytochrome c